MHSCCSQSLARRQIVLTTFLFFLSHIPTFFVSGDSPLSIPRRPKDATRVRGFASSKQQTVFGQIVNPTKPTETSQDVSHEASTVDPFHLYARHSPSDGLLYLQINGTVLQVSADDVKRWKCTVLATAYNLSLGGNTAPIMPDSSSATDSWIPLEGLFGMYSVPSGTIWVLVTGSESVYEAPTVQTGAAHNHQAHWFQIRRVTDMELVHIPCSLLPAPQLKEEVRQVQLLRKALKQHTFYYVPTTTTGRIPIVPDMTKHLQRSFQRYLNQSHATPCESQAEQAFGNHESIGDNKLPNSTTGKGSLDAAAYETQQSDEGGESSVARPSVMPRRTKWWWETFVPDDANQGTIENAACTSDEKLDVQAKVKDATRQRSRKWWDVPADTKHADRPDSRFFWNEAAVEPLVHRYHSDKIDSCDNNNDADGELEVDGNEILLENSLTLTSAFVGVQQQLALTEGTTGVVYDEVLISRRSRFRAGTRFTKRGADATGAVANYAETEQLCLISSQEGSPKRSKKQQPSHYLQYIFSYIQTRGSIPLRWSSPTDIKTYRPRVRIGTDPIAQTRALLAHVMEQLSLYTKGEASTNMTNNASAQLVFVNLIDKKSDQGRLGRTFDAVLEAVLDVYSPRHPTTNASDATQAPMHAITLEPNTVKHIWYDFHAEVKNGRWDRLAKLLKTTNPALLDHAYFAATAPTKRNPGWTITNQQNGVVRTNCMDCLDRTNVVQSLFGRAILFHQLHELAKQYDETGKAGLFVFPALYAQAFTEAKSLSLPWENGEVAHRLLWADNADAISRLYAGTAALKGDFTRTGKRTRLGALDDGMNSLQRYYLNNFLDADRQEGTDLMVGHSPFSNLGGDNDKDDDKPNTHAKDDSSGMTLQDAARQMLLGNSFFHNRDEDEKDYTRIKKYQHHSYLRESLDRVSGGAAAHLTIRPRPHARPLDLRWLPGDLQDQMRSRAMTSGGNDATLNAEFSSMAALAAIDRRAASGGPWWVVPESANDDNGNDDNEAVNRQEVRSAPGTMTIHAGYVLSTLLLSTRAPLSVASLVVLLMGTFYLPLPPDDRKDDKKK